ncbi:hypothetical protein [Haematobacter genomosp. 1]|uniref:hypothetical protein n=1 Tax=Haematobacter genomosp. 1 TaxID=366618 RepID=UPI00117AD905|nr:hypothetical protein [Haematobacter genomosp. 1]
MSLPAALPKVHLSWPEQKEPATRSTTAMILQERDSAGIGRISPALRFKIAMKIQVNLMVL